MISCHERPPKSNLDWHAGLARVSSAAWLHHIGGADAALSLKWVGQITGPVLTVLLGDTSRLVRKTNAVLQQGRRGGHFDPDASPQAGCYLSPGRLRPISSTSGPSRSSRRVHGHVERRCSASSKDSSRLWLRSSASRQRGQRTYMGHGLESGLPLGRHSGFAPERNLFKALHSNRTSDSSTPATTWLHRPRRFVALVRIGTREGVQFPEAPTYYVSFPPTGRAPGLLSRFQEPSARTGSSTRPCGRIRRGTIRFRNDSEAHSGDPVERPGGRQYHRKRRQQGSSCTLSAAMEFAQIAFWLMTPTERVVQVSVRCHGRTKASASGTCG